MLVNVPSAINRMTRNIVINHPNTWECQVYRKSVTRADEPLEGGLPAMGGLGVLSSDDEEKVEWQHLGNGYALPVDQFSPSSMMDRQDANIGFANEFRFLIEAEAETNAPGYFVPRKNDILVLVITDDVRLAFEIVDVEAVNNIPPFSMRYVANRRGDLDLI